MVTRDALVVYIVVSLTFATMGCKKTPVAAVPSATAQSSDTSWCQANNRGVALMARFDFDAAAHVFGGIVAGRDDLADVEVNQAIALLNRRHAGDAAAAMAIFERVLARSPSNLRAVYCEGLLRLNEGKTAEALAQFRRVSAADVSDAHAAYYCGQCLASLGKPGEAIAEYERAIRIDPLLRSAHYGAFQALQQLGRNEEATARLAEFQRLADDPRATLAEFKYTRMGKKAEAVTIDLGHDQKIARPAGPIFADAIQLPILNGAGVRWRKFAGTGPKPTITAADIDGDGRLDLFITSAIEVDGQIRNAVLLQRDHEFELDLKHPLASVTDVNAAVWGDFDNDGLVDVYLCRHGPNQLWRQIKPGQWQDITESAHAAGGNFNTIDAAAVDADHDGDLDLFLVRSDGPNELLNNNLDGTFSAIGEKAGIAGDGREAVGLVVADLNHDGLVDLMVLKTSPPNEVYLNEGGWKYRRDVKVDAVEKAAMSAAVALDIEGDGQVSIIGISDGLLRTLTPDAAGIWRELSTSILEKKVGEHRGGCIAVADLSGEGKSEIIVSCDGGWTILSCGGESVRGAGSTRVAEVATLNDGNALAPSPPYSGERAGVRGYSGEQRNSTNRPSPQPSPPSTGERGQEVAESHTARSLRSDLATWSLINLDPTSGPAIVALPAAGSPPILWKPGTGRFPFAGLALSGRQSKSASMRSNASGIGVQIAARADSRWTVASTFRNQSGPGQSLQPLSLGTGSAGKFDFVRLTWPDGLLQTELDVPAGKLSMISEVQRQTSSCPILFAWDGSRYAFVTDCLGPGGLGFATGPGEYAPVRPWENILLPQGLLKPQNGKFVIKIAEPMEEACYLDSAALVSYDLPPGWSMTLDERMGINDPQPTGRALFYRSLVLPRRAVNDRGEDVTAAVSRVDGIAAEPGKRDPRFIGLTAEHFVEMTFDQPICGLGFQPMFSPGTTRVGNPCHDARELILIADGWIEYPYSQTMVAAAQARVAYRAPSLEACGVDGKWVVVLDQFGYPAGMPRQMSVPMPLARLPQSTTRLRIRTNQEIYWDRLGLAWAEPCPQAHRHEFRLASAVLTDAGFPSRTTGQQQRPDYADAYRVPLWDMHHQAGLYTAFGPVDEVLRTIDDACVIFGPGEEVRLEFAAQIDPPIEGWQRGFVLELAGWCKDRDLYTKDGRTVEPLPMRDGATPESIRLRDELHRRFDTRYRSGG